jgi:hypothetical protein
VVYRADAETDGTDELYSVLRNQPPPNSPPTAVAGTGGETECTSAAGTLVHLDGSGSSDPDSSPGTNDDIVLFEWFEDFGLETEELLGTGETLAVSLALGDHEITLRVTDTAGESDTDALVASVVDTTAPELTCSASTATLWPPNHAMTDIGWEHQVTDACDDGAPPLGFAIHSDEDPAGASGAGGPGHCPDGRVGTDGNVSLRAERSGGGDGRVYRVLLTATDASGNSAECKVSVDVPKSRGRNGAAVDGGPLFDATECESEAPVGPEQAAPMQRAPDAPARRSPREYRRQAPG